MHDPRRATARRWAPSRSTRPPRRRSTRRQKLAVVFRWPGAIHEGGGECQPVVDSRAIRDSARRCSDHVGAGYRAVRHDVRCLRHHRRKAFDPIFAPIEFDVDVDARRGKVRVDGVFELDGKPIRNPVTGDEHRARIDLPNGFEYEIAEVGSASSRSRGNIRSSSRTAMRSSRTAHEQRGTDPASRGHCDRLEHLLRQERAIVRRGSPRSPCSPGPTSGRAREWARPRSP